MTSSRGPDFTAVVDLARTAPSVHNTQPWRFTVDSGALVLSAAPERQLHTLDPGARQLVISCGAALFLAGLALRQQGFDSEPEILDADRTVGEAPELVRLRPVPGEPARDEEVDLAREATRRHMHRAPFEDRQVSDADVHAMQEAVGRQGAWVRFLRGTTEQVPLAVLLSRADDAEREDPAYLEELAAWTAGDAASGVPREAAGGDLSTRASTLRLREFDATVVAGPTAQGRPGAVDPPPAEHPLVAVIGTEGDGRRDWLTAGQALSALLLEGSLRGVSASPLGQVLDLEWTRQHLAAELGVQGSPQMVLRLGYAKPGPQTPRRPVADAIDPP